jgi:Ca2+-binding EF-hand superfamily protein
MEEEEYSEAFHHYAKNGRLGPHDLRELMKYLGYNPSDSEIRDMMRREGGGSGIDSVDYNDFHRIMRDQINNLEADEHLIQCFRVLDRVDNGYVSAAEFKHLMTYAQALLGPFTTFINVYSLINKNDYLFNYVLFINLSTLVQDAGRQVHGGRDRGNAA